MQREAKKRWLTKTLRESRAFRTSSEDTLRRFAVEHPPDLKTSKEKLAFYRGFLRGCGRREDEAGRFESFKDLVYRIAEDLDSRWRGNSNRMSYEDLISAGYEAVLDVLRQKREPSRPYVAGVIRNKIRDEYRSFFGRHGEKHKSSSLEEASESLANVEPMSELEAEDFWSEIERRIDVNLSPDSRFAGMLKMKIQGKTLKEIGEHYGFSESLACRIFAEHREWMEQELLPLALPS